MIREGVDFSGARPTAEAVRAAGRDFVVRYARCFTTPKCITAAEVDYWQAHRIDVAIVDEVGAGRMLDGFTAGVADAQAARKAVISVGGPSDGGVIHFACDVDTTTDLQREAAADYLRGAATVLGWDHVGVYGEYEVIAWVHDHDKLPVRYLWETYAWSGGVRHPAATLYQYLNGQTLDGVEVDYDRAYAADFGQWGGQDMTTLADAKVIWSNYQAPVPGTDDTGLASPAYPPETVLYSARAAAVHAAETASAVSAKADALAAQVEALAAAGAAQANALGSALAALQAAVAALTPATTGDLTVTGSLHLGAP